MTRLQQLLDEPTIVILGWSLLHFLWQELLVAFAVALVLRASAQRSAQTRYALAGGGMLVLLACPILTFIALSQEPRAFDANSGLNSASLQPASASGGDAGPATAANAPLLDQLAGLPARCKKGWSQSSLATSTGVIWWFAHQATSLPCLCNS